MKSIEIVLRSGLSTLLDETDLALFDAYSWVASDPRPRGVRYLVAPTRLQDGRYRKLSFHRMVMGLEHGNKLTVDHINGNGLDNRRSNLRVCEQWQNALNRHGPHRQNKCGVLGVIWHEKRKKWWAQIKVRGQRIDLGFHESMEAAAAARRAGELQYCGEFRPT